MKVTNGEYKACRECRASWTEPLPEGWTVTVHGKYGLGGEYITPHLKDCTKGFKSKLPADD